jgi:Uma2 family endonuclease
MNTILAEDFLPKVIPERTKSVRLHFEFENEPNKMTPDEFWEFCRQNHKLRAELTKEGEVIIMPPTGFETSDKNSEINLQLRLWAKKDKTGIATESNAGFILPNGATRSPDAAWTKKDRLEKFTAKERQKFLPLCPDFVIELRSASDTLKDLQEKMEEYIENGARLGWLIDPQNKRVYVYRPNAEIKILENPETVSGEGILKGFELDLKEIW